MNLSDRQRSILTLIVKEYTESGEPVSSKLISECLGVSSATVRNEMALLTDLSLLFQPHTSSGRAPSVAAFRLYIDNLSRKALVNEQDYLRQIFSEHFTSVERLLNYAGTVLSQLTRCPVIVCSSVSEEATVQDVKLIPIDSRSVMICVVVSKGLVKTQSCTFKDELSNDAMVTFINVCRRDINGKHLEQVNTSLMQSISKTLGEHSLCVMPLLNALVEMISGITATKLTVEGSNRMLVSSGLNMELLHEFASVLSSEELLSQVLRRAKAANAVDGTSVLLADEIGPYNLRYLSFIVSQFAFGDASGSLSVLGPIRMDYEHMIPSMTHFTKELEQKLQLMLND